MEKGLSGCDPRVRSVLVCPSCHGALTDARDGLVCPACQRLYPVVDGVPWMLPERARPAPRRDEG